MRWLGVSLLPMLLVAMCLAQPLKEWPLPNPGFEQGLQGWALVKATNASNDTAVGHTGAASLKLAADDQSHPYVAQAVKDLQGGATYALRVWARGVKGGQADPRHISTAVRCHFWNATRVVGVIAAQRIDGRNARELGHVEVAVRQVAECVGLGVVPQSENVCDRLGVDVYLNADLRELRGYELERIQAHLTIRGAIGKF